MNPNPVSKQAGGQHIKSCFFFMWFSYDFGTSTVAVDTEKLMKSGSTWYSTGSFWPDLPNGRKISGWLHRFHGKLAVHPGVGVAQLTINKFLQNPPSSCAARHPPAFEQLEYCWPWNIVAPPIDPILSRQLRLSGVERAHNNGCWYQKILM
jgi:hypothetical protein